MVEVAAVLADVAEVEAEAAVEAEAETVAVEAEEEAMQPAALALPCTHPTQG